VPGQHVLQWESTRGVSPPDRLSSAPPAPPHSSHTFSHIVARVRRAQLCCL
jgi:hypothetical protein